MIEKLRNLCKKHIDIISYLFFGGLTTMVNYLVYFPLYNYLHLSGVVSNVIAWCTAVIFAYLTNKPFVFKSYDWSMKTVLPELGKFIGCRVGSGALETGVIWLTVDYLKWNGNLMKILVAVLVVILNYVGSKLLVFRKK
ncbi:MAG: GtrA family protein [Oscillospiraceae bacterium]|nr:GtrA family protein [Oscillospiraceae bacterium]